MRPRVMKARLIEYLDKATLKRRRGLVESAALAAVRTLRPGFFETRAAALDAFSSRRRVMILAASDEDSDLYRRLQWGDYWIKHELVKAFADLGYLVTNIDRHLLIHMSGGPARLLLYAHNVI